MAEARATGVGASRWRTTLVLLVATLSPLLIYILVASAIGYRDDQRATKAATLARAERISAAVDARLDVVSATMRALGTIRSIRERNWDEARDRAAEIAALDTDWRDVTLTDVRSGRVLFDLKGAKGSGARRGANGNGIGPSPSFGGVARGADGRPAVTAAMSIAAGGGDYVLSVELDPGLVQEVLVAGAPKEGVSAIVDRRGLFVARTMAWSERVGRPATPYVRNAIRSGTSGVYKGVTYEGLENFTAFATSPRTGWSAHVAVSSAVLDGPINRSRMTAGLAGLAALALAVAIILLVLRLVSVRRNADERTRQTERLEAVGKLTGGIAHDFNNMLAIVIGSLDLAQRRLASGKTDVARNIDNAMEGARRAAELTGRLLAFSRRQPLAPAVIDVNDLVKRTGELLRRTLSGDIAVEMRLQPALWHAFADPGQLENALVNLAVNARDAMPDGGTLTVATENREGERGSTDMIALSVRDTGTGMPADVAARAFEPFYTTKEVGQGTGLGLSQIHGFATQSGGSASIESRPGQGTAVTILLPRHTGPEMPSARPTDAAIEDAPPGRAEEIVLVVEDEAQVRMTNVEALRALGYTVRHAADAGEAVGILGEQPGIRLMLTDIVMPGMSGRELADLVAREHPDVRILLTTGFERDQLEADEERILRKPFSVGELARRVRREFDRAA